MHDASTADQLRKARGKNGSKRVIPTDLRTERFLRLHARTSVHLRTNRRDLARQQR